MRHIRVIKNTPFSRVTEIEMETSSTNRSLKILFIRNTDLNVCNIKIFGGMVQISILFEDCLYFLGIYDLHFVTLNDKLLNTECEFNFSFEHNNSYVITFEPILNEIMIYKHTPNYNELFVTSVKYY